MSALIEPILWPNVSHLVSLDRWVDTVHTGYMNPTTTFDHLRNAEAAVDTALEHLAQADAPEHLIAMVRKAGGEIYGYGCSLGAA